MGPKPGQIRSKKAIDLNVDRKIMNYMYTKNVALELVHQTGYNKNRSQTSLQLKSREAFRC